MGQIGLRHELNVARTQLQQMEVPVFSVCRSPVPRRQFWERTELTELTYNLYMIMNDYELIMMYCMSLEWPGTHHWVVHAPGPLRAIEHFRQLRKGKMHTQGEIEDRLFISPFVCRFLHWPLTWAKQVRQTPLWLLTVLFWVATLRFFMFEYDTAR